MHDFDMFFEDITAETCQELPTLLDKRSNSHPVEWSEITRAKGFLQGLYAQHVDHDNSSTTGAFCPALVQQFAHKLLDLGVHATGTKFTWTILDYITEEDSSTVKQIIQRRSTVGFGHIIASRPETGFHELQVSQGMGTGHATPPAQVERSRSEAATRN